MPARLSYRPFSTQHFGAGRGGAASTRFLRIVNIWHRNPSEVVTFFLNMSDTGKVNVVESHQVSILRGVCESKFSLCSCCFWIDIKLDRNGGGCELHILNMESVAPKHQLLAAPVAN